MKYVLAATAAMLLAATAAQAQTPSAEAVAVIDSVGSACDVFDYEEVCFRAMDRALTSAEPFSDADKAAVYAKVRGYGERRASWVDDIAKIFTDHNIPNA